MPLEAIIGCKARNSNTKRENSGMDQYCSQRLYVSTLLFTHDNTARTSNLIQRETDRRVPRKKRTEAPWEERDGQAVGVEESSVFRVQVACTRTATQKAAHRCRYCVDAVINC